MAQREVLKGCSKGHNPQQASVNCSILVPPVRGQECSQPLNVGGKSVHHSGTPGSQEEPGTQTGYFSAQPGHGGLHVNKLSRELLMLKKAQLHQCNPC